LFGSMTNCAVVVAMPPIVNDPFFPGATSTTLAVLNFPNLRGPNRMSLGVTIIGPEGAGNGLGAGVGVALGVGDAGVVLGAGVAVGVDVGVLLGTGGVGLAIGEGVPGTGVGVTVGTGVVVVVGEGVGVGVGINPAPNAYPRTKSAISAVPQPVLWSDPCWAGKPETPWKLLPPRVTSRRPDLETLASAPSL
jgi:hypothetical protein